MNLRLEGNLEIVRASGPANGVSLAGRAISSTSICSAYLDTLLAQKDSVVQPTSKSRYPCALSRFHTRFHVKTPGSVYDADGDGSSGAYATSRMEMANLMYFVILVVVVPRRR